MNPTTEAVSVKGKSTPVGSADICGKRIVVPKRFLKIATVKDDVCDHGVENPKCIIDELQREKTADLFSFDQKLPDTTPRFPYHFEWDNHAALEIRSFDHWWTKQIGNDARRMVRKAEKNGLVAKVVPFSDELVSGIKEIYDETPFRRGKPFWHYDKPFSEVKADNASFLERSVFIGAYLGNELVGFDKIIYTGSWGAQIQLIAKLKYKDKSPINVLLAKAIETSADRGVQFLTYGSYIYGRKGPDALTDFKKRNGFVQVDYPRYYVPLNFKGEMAVKLGIHRSLIDVLPASLVETLLKLRMNYYNFLSAREVRA
jgi:hypothetical protein